MRLTDFLLHNLPGELPADHVRQWIPGGYLGTAATIERMREFTTKYKRDFNIRKLAAKIIKNCPAKDYYCYAKALYEFCRDRIKYAYDPHMVELVESPLRVLEAGIADCDSICVLLASLNESIGLKTRFRTIKADRKRPDDFSHVYCVVRVPQSRYSQTHIAGWIAEDATLPDKQFGWEPSGPQVLGFKDWAASKDKDGEDENGVGGLSAMNVPNIAGAPAVDGPAGEVSAQLEVDRLCRDLNCRMAAVLRKGLEYASPERARAIVIGVTQVTAAAAAPVPVAARLQSVRNGYAYWTDVIDKTSGSLPDLVSQPMLSGYAPMAGLGATEEQNRSWINSYLAQVGDRLSRLNSQNAKSYYPTEMAKIESLLAQMRQEAVYGDPDLDKRERTIYRQYKEAVNLSVFVAQQLYNIGKRVDQPKDPEDLKYKGPEEYGGGFFGSLVKAVKNIFTPSDTHEITATYPKQAPVLEPAKPDLTITYTPKKTPTGLPEEQIKVDGGKLAPANGVTSWVPVLLVLGVVGAGLWYRSRQAEITMPKRVAGANPRRRRRGRSKWR